MNQADTAWMLVSTALVLLMTPALAFFYGGMVRRENALNTMMMSFISGSSPSSGRRSRPTPCSSAFEVSPIRLLPSLNASEYPTEALV